MNAFTDSESESVAAVGEQHLIASFRRWLGSACPPTPAGPGDDCAVVAPRKGRKLLVTTDPVVHGIHFDDSTSPAAAAAKLLRRNLSDIAAMGGTARFAIISWSIPARTRLRWLESFHRALGREAIRWGVTINGGDVSSTEHDLAAHLTLIGDCSGRALLRSGAKRGDLLYVTGSLGGSILGRHLRFEPRIAEGKWLARRVGVRCLIDLSDGLAKELPLITPVGSTAALESDRVPVSPAARRLAKRTGRSALSHALCDGEDFELLFALAGNADATRFEADWRRKFRTRLSRIGQFVSAEGHTIFPDGIGGQAGFDHFTVGKEKTGAR